MKVIWVTASPRVVATGAITTVRLAGGGNAAPYYRGGQHYRAGIAAPPRFSAALGFDENGWNGGTVPTTGQLVFRTSSPAYLAQLAAYHWIDAAILVETGEEGGAVGTLLTGTVASAAVSDGALLLEIADLSAALNKPLVTARFAGTGGAEGGTEAAGRIKRRSWGRVFNVEGRVFDKAYNLFEFGDPNFKWQQFDAVRDLGRAAAPASAVLAWQGSVAATITALRASAPADGSGVVAPSIAMCKWWTEPAGPLTADIRGEIGAAYVETAPEIAAAIVAAAAGPSIANVSAMAALRAGAAGLHIGDDSETAAMSLDRLLKGVSLLWILEPAGTIRLREWTFASPVETVRFKSVSRVSALAPIKERRLGYQKSHRLHNESEIAISLLQADADAAAKLGGIATGATKNRVFVQATDPALVPANAIVDGDEWDDTSVTPKLSKKRVLGAWINVANLVSQGTDIGVENGSTRNGSERAVNRNSTCSEVTSGTTPAGWTTDAGYPGVSPIAIVADAAALRGGKGMRIYANSVVYSDPTAVEPNEKVWIDWRFMVTTNRAGGGASQWYIQIQWFTNLDFAAGAGTDIPVNAASLTIASGAQAALQSFTAPATAKAVRLCIINDFNAATAAQGLLDYFSLYRDEPGSDVTSEITGPAEIVVNCDYTGAALAGELTKSLAYKLFRNGSAITAGITWSRTLMTGVATTAISGAGTAQLDISAISSDAVIRLQAAYAGTTRVLDVVVRRVLQPPPTGSTGGSGNPGATSTDSTISSSTATTYGSANGGPITVKAGTGGQVALTAPLTFRRGSSSAGTTSAWGKWQWRVVGGSFADVTTEIASSASATTVVNAGEPVEQNEGALSVAMTKTGLTSGTDYEFQLLLRGSAAITLNYTGVATAAGS